MYDYTQIESTKKDFKTDGTLVIHKDALFNITDWVFKIRLAKNNYDFIIPVKGSGVLFIEDLTETHVIFKDFIFGNEVYSEVKYSDFLIVKEK